MSASCVCVCVLGVGCDCAHVQCWSGLPHTYVISTYECVGEALARIPNGTSQIRGKSANLCA